jgi:hypothetical protein
MDDRDLRLDGNAVAGMLAEALAAEPTASLANCAGCGTSSMVGALVAYVHGMGAVLRCPSCESVMLRVGRGPGRMLLDLRGLRWLRVEVE